MFPPFGEIPPEIDIVSMISSRQITLPDAYYHNEKIYA